MELGLDFNSIPVGLGETHNDVSTLSPAGTVPVMVDSDLTLWDSRVIVEYIDAHYGAWRECQAWLERNWLHDSEYNAADCALAARLGVAEAYGAGVSREYPGLYARFEQLKQRSSWSLAYPENFIEPR